MTEKWQMTAVALDAEDAERASQQLASELLDVLMQVTEDHNQRLKEEHPELGHGERFAAALAEVLPPLLSLAFRIGSEWQLQHQLYTHGKSPN